jgi:hypothetical protein
LYWAFSSRQYTTSRHPDISAHFLRRYWVTEEFPASWGILSYLPTCASVRKRHPLKKYNTKTRTTSFQGNTAVGMQQNSKPVAPTHPNPRTSSFRRNRAVSMQLGPFDWWGHMPPCSSVVVHLEKNKESQAVLLPLTFSWSSFCSERWVPLPPTLFVWQSR